MAEKTKEVLDKESAEIKLLIDSALTRIITGKTKRTYQQELEFIKRTIQDYINISYITKVEHEKILVEQLLGWFNHFKQKHKKTGEVSLTIKEFEQFLEKNK